MKINLLFQKVLLLIIGLSINLMAFFILDFIVQNGFAAMFNFATIYPLLGVPVFLSVEEIIKSLCNKE